MALTEKGTIALSYAKQYFPTGSFCAKDLSNACGESIAAATLNAIVKNGYLERLGGTPVEYKLIDNIDELLADELETYIGTNVKEFVRFGRKHSERTHRLAIFVLCRYSQL